MGPTRSSPVHHWPYDEGPIADQLNSTRKHVASSTLYSVDWNNSTLITGDVAEYVAELKREDGPEIQVHGSPGLIQTLLENDLIDEYRLWIFPSVLGKGKRFFGAGTIPGGMKLVDSAVSKTGVTINTYERAGDIDLGLFEFHQPDRRRDPAANSDLAGGLVSAGEHRSISGVAVSQRTHLENDNQDDAQGRAATRRSRPHSREEQTWEGSS